MIIEQLEDSKNKFARVLKGDIRKQRVTEIPEDKRCL